MKRVVCLNVVQNVGIAREHQNHQVSTHRLLVFSGGECNESSESFNVNEDDVASLLNLKDMCRKEAPPIRHSNWCKKECDLQDFEGVFLVRSRGMASDLKEVILDNILGNDHVGLTMFYCLANI
jgi:hypothetical protein